MNFINSLLYSIVQRCCGHVYTL